MTRRLDIQGLRALAVLAIVVFHTGLAVPGGFTGVDVFFVISGFVITGTLLKELDSPGQMSVTGFYARRVKRLLPAPAAMITIVALVGILAAPAIAEHMAAIAGITSSLSAANLYFAFLPTGYFDPSTALNPLLHTWMLSVIVQLYLIAPVLLIGGWRLGRSRLGRGRSRELTFAIIAFLSLASFLLSIALSSGRLLNGASRDQRLAFYSSPTRAWEFGAGALLVLATPLLARLSSRSARVLGIAGAVAVGVSAFSIHELGFSATVALLPVAGSCLLLAAGIGSQVGVSRLLGLRPFVWLGDISFSLYLWHWPMIVFAKALYPYHPTRTAVVAVALSFLPAWLSYRYIENPIRYSARLSSRSRVAGRTAVALTAACILVPVGASFAQLGARKAVNASSRMESWLQSNKLHASELHGCHNITPLGERTGSSCIWKVARPRGVVVLFGDSNAGQFTEPVTRAGNRAGYNVDVVTASSCPYLGLRAASSEIGVVKDCPRFGSETLAFLVRSKPSLVILATRTDAYLQGSDFSLGKVGSGTLTSDTQAKARLWQSALTSTLLRLNNAGIPVLLVHPVPVLPSPPDGCAVARILMGKCGSTVSRQTVDSWLALSRRVENASIARTPATWALDFENEICAQSACSTMRDGIVQYRDYRHVSIAEALALTGSFYRAVIAHSVPRR